MITKIEQAVAAFLTAELAGDATVSAIPYAVLAATASGDVPGDCHLVICRVREYNATLRHLRDFTVACDLVSPAKQAGITDETHAAMELAIANAWEADGGQAAFDTAIQAALPGWHSGQFDDTGGGWEPAREDNDWRAGYVIGAGIARDDV